MYFYIFSNNNGFMWILWTTSTVWISTILCKHAWIFMYFYLLPKTHGFLWIEWTSSILWISMDF